MIQAVVKILGKSRERQGQKLLLLTETEEDKKVKMAIRKMPERAKKGQGPVP
jgi:hypothetical protein